MKPNASHFIVFGCVAYAHIPKEIKKKLDDRGERCIFLGYSETSKAYKLYNHVTKKFIISIDVKLQEDKSWNDKLVESYVPIIHADEEEDLSKQKNPSTRLQVPNTSRQVEQSSKGEKTSHNPSSSDNSSPTIASMQGKKTRSPR